MLADLENDFIGNEEIELFLIGCSSQYLLIQDHTVIEDTTCTIKDYETFYWQMLHELDDISYPINDSDRLGGDFQQTSCRKGKSVDQEPSILLSLREKLYLKVILALITIQSAGRAKSRTLAENCFLILLNNLASDNIQVVQNVKNPEHTPRTYSVDQRTINKSDKNCKFSRTCCKEQTYIQ